MENLLSDLNLGHDEDEELVFEEERNEQHPENSNLFVRGWGPFLKAVDRRSWSVNTSQWLKTEDSKAGGNSGGVDNTNFGSDSRDAKAAKIEYVRNEVIIGNTGTKITEHVGVNLGRMVKLGVIGVGRNHATPNLGIIKEGRVEDYGFFMDFLTGGSITFLEIYYVTLLGNVAHPQWLFRGFQDAVADCALIDISLTGYMYTWFSSRGSPNAVEERLDRVMVNPVWHDQFPEAFLLNLVAPISDHNPIMLSTEPFVHVPRSWSFKFENR
ncbi:hypothetical protein ACS0TY_004011 [Phlomoides rotata]